MTFSSEFQFEIEFPSEMGIGSAHAHRFLRRLARFCAYVHVLLLEIVALWAEYPNRRDILFPQLFRATYVFKSSLDPCSSDLNHIVSSRVP